MLIENALSDAVRFFHLDALSSGVGLKVDFDMALLGIASGLYRLLARTMRGYADAQARQIFRDLIDMSATVEVAKTGVNVQFHRRAHLPIVIASGRLNKPIKVPWWMKCTSLTLTLFSGETRLHPHRPRVDRDDRIERYCANISAGRRPMPSQRREPSSPYGP